MAQSDRLYFRADEQLRDDLERFQERHDFEDRSKATRELVEVGLREQQHPILWRAKDRLVEWINLLSISAVVLFVLGVTTSIITAADGVIAAFFMLTLACVLLAAFEFTRVLAGMNEIGVRARGILTTVVGGRE